MKKWISFSLALVLVLCISVSSFANWDTGLYNWADAENTVLESFPGEYSIRSIPEINATLWLPLSFSPVELTPEDIQAGYLANFMTGPEDAFVMFHSVDSEGYSLDNLLTSMTQKNLYAKKVSVNGIPSVLQRDYENGILYLYFLTAENKLLEISFFPVQVEPFYDLVISSIQPIEEEDVSEPVVSSSNPVSALIYK